MDWPRCQLTRLPLFAEHDLPGGSGGCPELQDIEPHRNQIAIVIEIVKFVAGAVRLFPVR